MTYQSQGSTAAPPHSRLILTVLSGAAFMASLDLFIVNVALTDIGRDFRSASLGNLSWVLNGYAILYAALLVPLGRLADRYGRKSGFLLGLTLFTVASAACAVSPDTWVLVGFRALQAIGAAALTPTSLGLLLAATPPAKRQAAVRVWAATGALAAAAGPVIGGLLVELSWRWAFIINIPIGIAALVIAYRVVPDSRDTSVQRVPDLLGAGVFAVAIGALALGLVKGGDWGWGSAAVVGSLVVAVAGTAWFWWRSHRHGSPVIDPALLRVRTFGWSNLTSVLFGTTFAATLLCNILWVQDVWGYSALRTGLAIAPGPLMVPVFAAVAQRLSRRISAGRLTAIGCLLCALGTLWIFAFATTEPNYAVGILPGWLIGGAGVGFALPTILSAATVDLPTARTSTGSAIISMTRQVGTVVGVSMLVAIIGTPVGLAAAATAFDQARLAIAGLALLTIPFALGMSSRRTSHRTAVDVRPSPALATEPS